MRKTLIFIILLGCSMKRNIQKSDHYDPEDDRFKNQYVSQTKGLWKVIKWKLTTTPKTWPEWVELKHTPRLEKPEALSSINLTFVGHSSFLIQTKDINILTDPVWSHRVSPVTWAGPARHHAPGVKLEDLPKIDVIVVSHNHYDHMDLSTLKKLDKKFSPLILCPKGDKNLLDSEGLTRVIELDWWENREIETASGLYNFIYTPSQHFSGRGAFDRFKSLWGSFVIQTPSQKQIFFGGDTGYSQHFKDIFERIGRMDFSLIPIGAYEPRWFMKDMHIDPTEAVKAHQDLESKQSVGIHFGTFQLTDEAIDEPEIDLNKALEKQEIDREKFTTLAPGESRVFDL